MKFLILTCLLLSSCAHRVVLMWETEEAAETNRLEIKQSEALSKSEKDKLEEIRNEGFKIYRAPNTP